MADSVLDQMTRLKLRLLEKRLENEREDLDERAGTALSTRSVDGLEDALHSALRRKRDLLQKLKGASVTLTPLSILLLLIAREVTWEHPSICNQPSPEEVLSITTTTMALLCHSSLPSAIKRGLP
ncbi:hypothetical protein SKAU_G00238000 [Synaphobranchus kaupii]|uniref:Uncharacterized protein n=1 Tax=Synaphobranchus kaupii TaxID=118154 RepID=A0A9Q1F701_SYNKA|nr:hypothetical protein SKAU_G00238000 [Synaphobranchus kaupii]